MEQTNTKGLGWIHRLVASAGGALALLMGFGLVAMAEPTPSEQVGTALGDAAGDIFDTVLEVATTVLPYAAVLAGLFIGWSIVRRFISS